jgi:hypothetical protein
VTVCTSPVALARRLESLLREPELRAELGRIGCRRMGVAGGSDALAALVEHRLLSYP